MNGHFSNIAAFCRSPRDVPASIVREVVVADPDAGAMTWLNRPRHHFANDQVFKAWNVKYPGKPAFNVETGGGYRCGYIFNVKIKAHRAMWAYVHGEWPKGYVDHINGDPSDNRISNLREADLYQSVINRSSGGVVPYFGVHLSSQGRFRAQVQSHGVVVWAGIFDDALSAAIARYDAAMIHHGAFARLNFPERRGF